MNSSVFLSFIARSNQLGRLSTCRRCLLRRSCRLLPQLSSSCVLSVSERCFSTSAERRVQGTDRLDAGFWSNFRFDMGFITGLKYPKSVLNLSGFRMFVCCTESIDHAQFFTEFDLPDTFNSWFLVTDLHIWLCMVRLSALDKDGRVLRNCLVKAMWEDIQGRSKQLGSAASMTARKEGIGSLADLFHASLFAYDEGLLGDDKQLAGALWRIFFEMKTDVDPGRLELLVAYVRKQVAHLDQQEDNMILRRGYVTFLPLRGETADKRSIELQTSVADRFSTSR